MSRRRKLSALKIVLIGLPLVVVMLLLSSTWWLLKTSSGAAWIWGHVESAAAGSMRSSRVEGDLASGFSIRDFEYLTETVELSARQLEVKASPGLWPLSIQVSSLVLRDVEVATLPAREEIEDARSGRQIQSALESLRFPVGVYVHAAEMTNITLRAGDSAPLTVADSISFSVTLDQQLLVKHLVLLAPGIEMTLDAELALQDPFDASMVAHGQIVRQESASMPGLVFPFSLESAGALDKLQFTLASPGLELGAGEFDFAVLGTLSTTGVQLDRVALTGSGLELEGGGTVGWSVEQQAGLKLTIRRLDLSPWLPAWPAGQQLLGDLELNWSNAGLEIPRGRLALADTDLAIDLAADIDVETNAVDAQVSWRDLDWPLADTPPEFSSPSGRLVINGSLDHWEATGELIVKLGDYPQGRLEILGGGNRTSAHMTIPRGELLGGDISGEAGADWQDGLSWNLSARSSGINPEPVLPGWPGRLDAEIEVSADSRSEMIQIKLASLAGSMRGVPLSGHGGLSLAGGAMTLENVTFDDVELSTDDAVLQLSGTASRPAGVHLTFNGRLPSRLLQGATGNVELAGRYTSDAGNSLLDVQLQARGLAWNGYSARALTVTTDTGGQHLPIPGLHLQASGLAWRGISLDEFSLAVEPAGEQYRLNASLAAEHMTMNTTVTLEPVSQHDPFNHPWRGVLDKLTMTASQAYQFELQEKASMQWSPDSLSLGQACIRENSGARFCVNGSYGANGDWFLVADVAAVPLDYLRAIFDLNVRFEQYLEGRLEWRQTGGQPPAGGAEFRIAAGRILDLDDDDVLTETDEGRFAFKLVNGNLESGVLDIEFPGTGFMDVDFKVLDIIEHGGGDLSGRAITRLDSLKLVGQLALTALDDLDGRFESNIQLGGSVTNPSFDGTFSLSNGLVRYAPIGLYLDQIDIQGLLEKSNRGSLKGSFRAGDGEGTVDGHILFEDIDNMLAEVSLSGDRLLLVNTDDLKIYTETDLQIGLAPQRLDINGRIHIPNARLKPANLLVEKVSDSEDLVIEGQVVPVVSGAGDKPPARRIYGQLEVAFGDDVLLKVPDIKTNISGSVLYQWQGDPIPLADGSYRLNGQVDVYGPRLEITNGTISFPGIPADNPLLNIKAEREIFGNTQIRSAGVQLIGTLKRQVIEAYTVPLTNEDRAWTLLVTGTDFDQSQGVGGFDVGTYIAPNLYVSYGISLFEDENVISARYDLKKGFGVKITSGQRETGVDVSYTIDR